MNQKLTNIVADLPEKIWQSIESGGPVPLAYLDKARAYWEEAKAQGVRPPEMTENDWWGDFLREKYLPVARLAKIPPKNFLAFAKELDSHVDNFEDRSITDDNRTKLNMQVNELTKAERMILAIEKLEKREERDDLSIGSPIDISFSLQTGGVRLEDLKRELSVLRSIAKFYSAEHVPKQKENRTKILIQKVWLTAEKYGGELTFNKHGNGGKGSGTLINSLDLLYDHMAQDQSRQPYPTISRTKLSPSTIDRLRPRR